MAHRTKPLRHGVSDQLGALALDFGQSQANLGAHALVRLRRASSLKKPQTCLVQGSETDQSGAGTYVMDADPRIFRHLGLFGVACEIFDQPPAKTLKPELRLFLAEKIGKLAKRLLVKQERKLRRVAIVDSRFRAGRRPQVIGIDRGL